MDSADPSGTGQDRPRMATASSVLVKGHFAGGTTGRGRAWPRVTQEKGGCAELGLAALSTPAPQGPASSPPWFWGALCPRGRALAALRERREDMALPGKGAGLKHI